MPTNDNATLSFSIASALFVGVLAFSIVAHADDAFVGRWDSGPTRIDAMVEVWPAECGPRPVATNLAGDGLVNITRDGDHLVFAGARTNRTDQCWSENRTIRKISASVQNSAWRTICRTPATETKGETETVSIASTGDGVLTFNDRTEYDWRFGTATCRALITATRTYRKQLAAAPVAQVAATPTPTTAATTPAVPCTPNGPLELRIAPANATIEPGARVCFHAHQTDAKGCVAGDAADPRWSFDAIPGRRATLDGSCFVASDVTAEAEGDFHITVQSGSARGHAIVHVAPKDLSDLIASPTAVAAVPENANVPAATKEEAGVSAVSKRENHFGAFALIAIILAGIGAGAWFAFGRTKPKAIAREETPAFPVISPVARVVDTLRDPEPIVTGENKICPVCRRGHPSTATECSADGTPLVAYSEYVAREKQSGERSLPRVCPKCGARFAEGVVFCGKDGARLESST